MTKKYFYLTIIFILVVASFMSINQVFAESLSQRLKGSIVLQVESKGEAWYINPSDNKRYSLGRPDEAFGVMRQKGIGITNRDLGKISIAIVPVTGADQDGDLLSDMFETAIGTNSTMADSDMDGYLDNAELASGYNPSGSGRISIDTSFSTQQKGKILLQVEGKGEAWYVNPRDLKRYFLGRPQDAFSVMREKGIGITNKDINTIIRGDSGATLNATVLSCGSDITDNDGYKYKTVKIGTQCWMAENLKSKTKPNGVPLTNLSDGSERDCISQDNNRGTEADCQAGYTLYTWNGTMNGATTEGVQGICPNGWHIPTDGEWHILEAYLAEPNNPCDPNRDDENSFLPENQCLNASTKLLLSGSNVSGFNAILAGLIIRNGSSYDFSERGNSTFFWSSTTKSSNVYEVRTRGISNAMGINAIWRVKGYKNGASGSIRCIKN